MKTTTTEAHVSPGLGSVALKVGTNIGSAQTTVASWVLKSEKGVELVPTPLSRVPSLLPGDLLLTRGRVSDGLTRSRRGESNLEEVVWDWEPSEGGDRGDLCCLLSRSVLSEIA